MPGGANVTGNYGHAVRQLFPENAEVEPAGIYTGAARPAPAGRPWVMVNMIASVDGGTAVDGVSGGLGGPSDRLVFSAIRSAADVILAGAATVRAEGYGPPRTSVARQAERTARGQPPHPRVAVVSRSLGIDLAGPLFTEGGRPVVITIADADPERLTACRTVADVLTAGVGSVDLLDALAQLAAAGVQTVLAEGGPAINGQLVAAGVIDEVCLTTAPVLLGGSSARIAHGPPATPTPLRLAHVLHGADDDLLFLRYVRA
ncbi:MAG: Pyrimidine reductase riboflavin biosynthesis-like protein [Acidimicrobiales bacterium]|nr:Pyrimidine reductase riboflavin biosynthesis-like protein [Acidimicrobiales bacterium]